MELSPIEIGGEMYSRTQWNIQTLKSFRIVLYSLLLLL